MLIIATFAVPLAVLVTATVNTLTALHVLSNLEDRK